MLSDSATKIFATNMRCASCLAKVAAVLDGEPIVKSWTSDLKDPRKVVRVELSAAGSAEQVITLIAEAGFTSNEIQDSPQVFSIKPPKSPSTFRFATYKPLFLVILYVLGAATLQEYAHSQWNWTRAMHYFMGFFFLGFAFFKLLDVAKFADAFAGYDLLARRSRYYAIAYPWIEVLLGLLFVTGNLLVLANATTAILMSIGLVGVTNAVYKKEAIQCACLGTAFNLPMSAVTIVENTTMIAMSLWMLVIESIGH